MIFNKTGLYTDENYIIGCDIAGEYSIDNSCASLICRKCNTIVDIKIFQNGEIVDYAPPKKCSSCGTKFIQ